MQSILDAQVALLRQALRTFEDNREPCAMDTPLSNLDVTSDDSPDSNGELECAPRVPSKKRKPTYYVRKEETVRLAKEVEELQRRVRELEATPHVSAKNELAQSMALNSFLSSEVETNNFALIGAQSMISAEMASRFRNPLDHYVYMPADEKLRRHSLRTLKDLKTEAAVKLVRECTRFLDIRQSHCHIECTVLKNGDYLVSQCDVTPFDGITDVRLVFDMFAEFIASLDVNVSGTPDSVTIRESDECVDSSMKQSRMLSSIAPGLDIETNAVLCMNFAESPDDVVPSFGVGIIDYVDKDDVLPYQPATRLRLDTTGCVYITQTSPDTSTTASGVTDTQPGTSMVRVNTIRLHRPQFPISKQTERLARASADNWNSVLPRFLLERLGLYY